jgi:hypothetical protein
MRCRTGLRYICCALAAGLLVVLSAPACRAGPLPITFAPGSPVIRSINGTISYDASTGNFHSATNALTFYSRSVPGGSTFFGCNGQVTVDLQVDSGDNFVCNVSVRC